MTMLTIKEKARMAFERDWKVVVTEKGNITYQGHIDSYDSVSNGQIHIVFPDPDRPKMMEIRSVRYLDITEIRLPDEEPGRDRSYPHCDNLECKERQGSSVYCNDEICVTRRIFVNYEESIKEDPKPSQPEPPVHDIASERLKVHFDGPNTVIVDGNGLRVAKRLNASVELVALMAAAPELVDYARSLVNEFSGWMCETYPTGLQELVKLIRKLDDPGFAPWYKGGDPSGDNHTEPEFETNGTLTTIFHSNSKGESK